MLVVTSAAIARESSTARAQTAPAQAQPALPVLLARQRAHLPPERITPIRVRLPRDADIVVDELWMRADRVIQPTRVQVRYRDGRIDDRALHGPGDLTQVGPIALCGTPSAIAEVRLWFRGWRVDLRPEIVLTGRAQAEGELRPPCEGRPGALATTETLGPFRLGATAAETEGACVAAGGTWQAGRWSECGGVPIPTEHGEAERASLFLRDGAVTAIDVYFPREPSGTAPERLRALLSTLLERYGRPTDVRGLEPTPECPPGALPSDGCMRGDVFYSWRDSNGRFFAIAAQHVGSDSYLRLTLTTVQ